MYSGIWQQRRRAFHRSFLEVLGIDWNWLGVRGSKALEDPFQVTDSYTCIYIYMKFNTLTLIDVQLYFKN